MGVSEWSLTCVVPALSCASTMKLIGRSCEGPEILGTITCFMSMFSGILTLLLWCFLLPSTSASLSVATGDFLSDVNKKAWREALFSFAPEVFVDVWTPFVFGFVTILSQFASFDSSLITKDFFRFAAWHLILALFANLGYLGGLGILCGSFAILTCLFSLVCAATCDVSPKLNFEPFTRTESLDF